MKKLSEKVSSLSASPIRVMFDKAAKMENVISFAVGEPGFTAADFVVQAAKDCMDRGDTHYTANSGILPLRQTVSEYVKNKKNVLYDPETEIMITVGGMQALSMTMQVILNPGDEVLVSDPCYGNYIGEITLPGGKPVYVPTREEDEFQFREEEIRAAITPATKAFLINSPCNPTGGVLTEKTLRMIADICKEYDLYLITDEVYQEFMYEGAEYFSVAALEGMKERTVIIDSVSKTYAMTGWRCGYLCAPAEIVTEMAKIQEYLLSCVPGPSQHAAMAALKGNQDVLEKMKKQYSRNRELIIDRVNKMPKLSLTPPKGAFYAFINISETGMESMDFCLKVLEEVGVVMSPGMAFGNAGKNYVRISYVTSEEELIEGMDRLEKFMKNM